MSGHNQKDFKRIMQHLESSSDFSVEKSKRKDSYMIKRNGSTEQLLVHSGDKAFHPIRRFVKKFGVIFK